MFNNSYQKFETFLNDRNKFKIKFMFSIRKNKIKHDEVKLFNYM